MWEQFSDMHRKCSRLRVVTFRSMEYYSLPIIMYIDCSVGLMYLKKYQEESTEVSIVSVSLLAQQSALHTYIIMCNA